jgi:hypothetical protein
MSRTGSFIKSEFIPTQCSCWRFAEVFHCCIGFFILSLIQFKETYRFIGKEKCLGKCLLDIREGNLVVVLKINSTRRGNGCHKVFWNGVLRLEKYSVLYLVRGRNIASVCSSQVRVLPLRQWAFPTYQCLLQM